MHGSVSFARPGRPHDAILEKSILMLVHRQGSDGEVLMLSELADIDTEAGLPEQLVPTTSLVATRTVSSDPDLPHFLLLRDLPKDFAPIGRFRPSRGLVMLRPFGEKVTLSAWGADDPATLYGMQQCWSVELVSRQWAGEIQFADDL